MWIWASNEAIVPKRSNKKEKEDMRKSIILVVLILVSGLLAVACSQDYAQEILDGEIQLSEVPQDKRDWKVYENWVRVDPLDNLKDVPNHIVNTFMWQNWVAAAKEDGVSPDGDVYVIQMAIGHLQGTLSVETWRGFLPYKADLLEKHPVALAFLPPWTLDMPGWEGTTDVEMYTELLAKSPYWAIVGSGDLPMDFVHAIPLEAWGRAVSSRGGGRINEYLPCSLNRALVDAGYTDYLVRGCESVVW